MNARVLIVEDREATARRLARTINADPSLTVIGCVQDVQEAIEVLKQERPDVALVDLGLPDGSGLEVISECDRSPWGCQAIVISIFGDEERVIDAIRHGAKGYLQKGATPEDIISGIKAVQSGGSPISPQIARHLLQELNRPTRAEPSNEREDILTPREQEILTFLSQGFRRQEVADKFNISLGTVGNHINNIYKKLGVNSNLGAVAKAGRLGLI